MDTFPLSPLLVVVVLFVPLATLIVVAVGLFLSGALRSAVTDESPIVGGLEMLGLGVAVAAVAYSAGTMVAWLLA